MRRPQNSAATRPGCADSPLGPVLLDVLIVGLIEAQSVPESALGWAGMVTPTIGGTARRGTMSLSPRSRVAEG